MNTNPINCAWWHVPPKTIEPLDLIRTTIECLDAGVALPQAEAAILKNALRQYFQGQTDITRNLGLRGCE